MPLFPEQLQTGLLCKAMHVDVFGEKLSILFLSKIYIRLAFRLWIQLDFIFI